VDCRDAQAVLTFTGQWVHRQGMASLEPLMAELARGEALLWWQALLQQPIDTVGSGPARANGGSQAMQGKAPLAAQTAEIEPAAIEALRTRTTNPWAASPRTPGRPGGLAAPFAQAPQPPGRKRLPGRSEQREAATLKSERLKFERLKSERLKSQKPNSLQANGTQLNLKILFNLKTLNFKPRRPKQCRSLNHSSLKPSVKELNTQA
jgi:hypothetical protein